MGEMVLRGIEEKTLERLRRQAEQRGLAPEDYAVALIGDAVAIRENPPPMSWSAARRILSHQTTSSSISSTDLLREIREAR